jgi:hypothetical protein
MSSGLQKRWIASARRRNIPMEQLVGDTSGVRVR